MEITILPCVYYRPSLLTDFFSPTQSYKSPLPALPPFFIKGKAGNIFLGTFFKRGDSMIPSMMKDTLTTTIRNRMSAMLVGTPGIGKTDVLRQAFEEKILTFRVTQGTFGPPLFIPLP